MPAKSEKQRRFMGAELSRKQAGKKTKTGMSTSQLKDFTKKPKKGYWGSQSDPQTSCRGPGRVWVGSPARFPDTGAERPVFNSWTPDQMHPEVEDLVQAFRQLKLGQLRTQLIEDFESDISSEARRRFVAVRQFVKLALAKNNDTWKCFLMIHIQNPYPRSLTDTGMIHANLPAEVYQYLKSVFPGHGNIQAVTNTLINHLVIALKSNGIERYNLENEQLIIDVLTGRTTDPDPPEHAVPRTAGRRTKGVRKRATLGKGKQHGPSKPHRKGGKPDPKTIVQDDA
jgi:hypothetical protein